MSRGVGVVGYPVARVHHRTMAPAVASLPTIQQTSAVAGTTVTADAVAHTKGAWVELITATTAAANWLVITFHNTATNATDTRQLLDVGFGAAASEVVKIANIPTGYTANGAQIAGTTLAFPINVPIGTRIAARVQAFITVDTVTVLAATAWSDGASPVAVDVLGDDAANSRGTNLPTSDTYVQLTAATTQPYRALIVVPAAATATVTATNSIYTVAVGASGAEVAVGTLVTLTSASETMSPAQGLPAIFPGHYPAGVRIACKQSTGATSRDVIVYGIPYA